MGNGEAVTYLDGRWSIPVTVDTHRSVSRGLATVSCSSAAFCVAGDGDGNAFLFDGRTWSRPKLVDKSGLAQVSCVAPSFCGAVAVDGDALTFDGSAWSSPYLIPGSGQPLAISCTTGSFCMALDGASQGAFVFERGRWESAGELNTSAPVGGSEPNVGSAVACSSTRFCAALDNFGEAFAWVSRKWSGPVQFDPNLMDSSDAVSCPSSNFCMVVDDQGLTTTWNGRSWSRATRIDPVDAGLDDVSCPTAQFCVAVDSYGRALTYH